MATTPSNKSLGTLIRRARLKSGRGLRELARLLGITGSYQSDIEQDRRVPAEEVLWATAQVLGLDVDELMARSGRIGAATERYLRRRPTAVALLRTLARKNA